MTNLLINAILDESQPVIDANEDGQHPDYSDWSEHSDGPSWGDNTDWSDSTHNP